MLEQVEHTLRADRGRDLKAFNAYFRQERLRAQQQHRERDFPRYEVAKARLIALMAEAASTGRQVRFSEALGGAHGERS